MHSRSVSAATIAIVVLLALGGSAVFGVEFYSSQGTLHPTEYPESSGQVGVEFNDSRGARMADLTFMLNYPITNSTVDYLVIVGPSIWHAPDTRLESLLLLFSLPEGGASCAVSVSGPSYYADASPGYQTDTRRLANGSVSLDIPDFGHLGIGTVNFGLGISVPRDCPGVDAARGMLVSAEIALHASTTAFVGADYRGHDAISIPLSAAGAS